MIYDISSSTCMYKEYYTIELMTELVAVQRGQQELDHGQLTVQCCQPSVKTTDTSVIWGNKGDRSVVRVLLLFGSKYP